MGIHTGRFSARRISRRHPARGSLRRYQDTAADPASRGQVLRQLAHRQQRRPRDSRRFRVFHYAVNVPVSLAEAAYAVARWGWLLATFLLLGAGSYAPFLFRTRTALHTTDPA